MKKNSKKKVKKKSTFSKLISTLFLILSFTLLFLLMSLKVLPNKYLIPVICSIVVLNIISYFLLNYSKSKIIKFIFILFCFGMSYGVFSLINTKNILSSMNIDYKLNNYVVLVTSNSNYNNIDDLNNKVIGILEDDKDSLDKLKIKYEKKEFDDISNIVTGLFDNDVDGIVLDQSYYDMLCEEDSNIDNFKDKVRIIYRFSYKSKVNNISKDVNTSKDSFTIYISGVDTYGSIVSSSRSDANMLVTINPKTHQILLISIPRDYYIDLVGKNGKDKLTHSGIYGIDTTVKSVEKLLNMDINYYYKINFTSLINIVDSLGSVEVYSKYNFMSKDGYKYSEGYNKVNGKEALSFVRERKAFSAGDRIRNINQQAMVEALFRKVTNPDILVKYNSLLGSLKNSFVTNMSEKSLTNLIKNQLDSKAKWNISSYSLDGTNSREYTYSYKANTLYVMLPNNDTVDNAKKLIKQVYDGKILENSYSQDVNNVKSVTKENTSNKTNYSTNNIKNSNTNTNSNNVVKKEYYSVTYIIDGKKDIIKVESGKTISKKDIPIKEGYEILGWYLGDELYDFTKTINSDIVLEARYNKIEDEILEIEKIENDEKDVSE